MIPLSAQITAMIVTVSMGLCFSAVAILCVVPIYEAIVERRRPVLPDIPATLENLGIALALGGLTYRETGVAALGLAFAVLGTLLAAGTTSRALPRAFQAPLLICAIVSLGVLGEYFYLTS